MILKLNAKQLRVDLGNLFQVVNASTILPILESVLIEVKDKAISFNVSDLENYCTYSIPTECEESYIFCLPCKSFLFFLRNSLEDEITIEVSNGKKTRLSCAGFSVNFMNYRKDIEQFPIKPDINIPVSFKINSSELTPKMQAALKFVSNDDLRPALTGVYFDTREDLLTIAATDAHSLYWENSIPVKDVKPFILSQKSIRFIASNFKNKEIEIFVEENTVGFKSDNVRVISRIMDCRYPDYKSVIQTYDYDFYMNRKQLSIFMRLASEYVNRSSLQIKLFVDKQKIMVDGGDIDFDIDFTYTLPIYNESKKVDSFYFALNIRMMKKVIDLSKDEYIKINHSQLSMKGFTIDDKYLIMPLSINN